MLIDISKLPSPITVGPITIDIRQLQVTSNGKTRTLTPNEALTLHCLALHPNTVCTVKEISLHAYGWSDENNGLIRVDIRHLRQKIEPDPNKPLYLLTIPGEGYMLVSNADH